MQIKLCSGKNETLGFLYCSATSFQGPSAVSDLFMANACFVQHSPDPLAVFGGGEKRCGTRMGRGMKREGKGKRKGR